MRRRASLLKKIEGKTGGGKLTTKEKRIVESDSYRDAALRMGISVTGNAPRFDSDSQDSVSNVLCHSKRLKRVLSRANVSENLTNSEETQHAFNLSLDESNESHGITSFQNCLTQPDAPTSISQEIPQSANVASSAQRQSSFQHASTSTSVSANVQQPGNAEKTPRPYRLSRPAIRNVREVDSTQTTENASLQQEYLNLQIKRTQIGIEREELQKRLVEIDVQKAEMLMMEEVNHKKMMMKLELEAKQEELDRLKRNL